MLKPHNVNMKDYKKKITQVACSPTCVVGENISWQRTQVGAFHTSLESICAFKLLLIHNTFWYALFVEEKSLFCRKDRSTCCLTQILQMSLIIMNHPCHEDQPGCWTCSTSCWPSIQPLVSQWSRPWLILTLRLVVYCCCS